MLQQNPATSPPDDATASGESTDPLVDPDSSELAQGTTDLMRDAADALEARIETWFPYYADAPLLQGVTVLLLFLLVASLASFFLKRVVARWFAKTETDLDDRVLAALTGPVYVTMLSLGFRIALTRVELGEKLPQIVTSLLATVIVLVWLRAAIKIAAALFQGLGNSDRFEVIRNDTVPLFSNLSTIAMVILGAYLIVVAWGGNVSGLLALGGVGGLIIGLAAQDSIGNLFAGIFIFADSPYKVGDYINLDTGERGKVTNIGIRSTRLLTRDDVEITIPNSAIASAKIVNESGGPHLKYRIRIPVGVAYGSDLAQVRASLERVAEEEPMALDHPSPRVRMRAFGASSLDFELLCWVADPELRGRAVDRLMVAVYERFAEDGIEIPFAQQDVYIKELPRSLRPGIQESEPD